MDNVVSFYIGDALFSDVGDVLFSDVSDVLLFDVVVELDVL